MPKECIALLGTGLLGRAVAERLLALGYPLRAFNRTREKALPLEAKGAQVAERVEEAVAGAEVVLLLLADARAIRETLLGSPADLSGKAVVQMGTIAPAEVLALAGDIEGRGGRLLEAPVLGSLPEAREGRLIIMAGGGEGLFQRLLPLLKALGHPRLIGPLGKGAALKLALNQLIASLTAAFSLSLKYVQQNAIPPDTFMEILRESALYAPTFDKKLPRMLSHRYDDPNFPARHLAKDVALFLKEAEGCDTRFLQAIEEVLERAVARGRGGEDYSVLFETLCPGKGALV